MENELTTYFKDSLLCLLKKHSDVLRSDELSGIKLVFIIGPPTCGKTTQGDLLSKKLANSKHVSCGQLLRSFCKLEIKQSKQLATLLNNGVVVDGNITITLMLTKIFNTIKGDPECKLFIIDGFPRNVENLKIFEDLKIFRNVVFVLIKCDFKNILHRQSIRMSIDKREDDTEEVLNKRMVDYNNDTLKATNLLKQKGKLIEINGNRDKNDILKSLLDELKFLDWF